MHWDFCVNPGVALCPFVSPGGILQPAGRSRNDGTKNCWNSASPECFFFLTLNSQVPSVRKTKQLKKLQHTLNLGTPFGLLRCHLSTGGRVGTGGKGKRKVSISNQDVWDHKGDPLGARAWRMLKPQKTPRWVFVT